MLKEIPQEFKTNGQSLKLIKRTPHVALYSVNNGLGYEIHKIRCIKLTVGNRYDAGYLAEGYTEKERLASNEDFGPYAKYCVELERAEHWFDLWNMEAGTHA